MAVLWALEYNSLSGRVFFLSFPLTNRWLQFSRRLRFFGGGIISQFVSLSRNNSCSDSILIIIDIESLQTNIS